MITEQHAYVLQALQMGTQSMTELQSSLLFYTDQQDGTKPLPCMGCPCVTLNVKSSEQMQASCICCLCRKTFAAISVLIVK